MQKIGFAILGTGLIADKFQMAIAASADLGAELIAVGHYKPEKFAAISEKFGVPCVTEQDLLDNPDVDVLCICTPSGQHAQQTITAAKAGKHVLVEKPIALSLADTDAMIAACEKSNVKLGVAYQSRTKSIFQKVKKAIDNGDLGELTLGSITMPYYRNMDYYNLADWRGTWELDGGGILMNQGIHEVDLLVWLMGNPTSIQAHAATSQRDIEVEDVVAATLNFENGALATITATTTADGGFPRQLELYGTGGGIQIEGEKARRWQVNNPAKETIEPPEIGITKDRGGKTTGKTSHDALIRDFIEAIRDNRPPLIDGHEGRRSLKTVLDVYKAAGLREEK
jgi:UDP-N-acetyl-2-amino-2-deoxyglucuronate dehydrogenase